MGYQRRVMGKREKRSGFQGECDWRAIAHVPLSMKIRWLSFVTFMTTSAAAIIARRDFAGLGFAAAASCNFNIKPEPVHAQKSKMVARASKEATAAAKAFKFSQPGEETEAFKAAERRRADVLAGVVPRDADRTPIRDPVTGKDLTGRTYQDALATGDDSCARPPFCRK